MWQLATILAAVAAAAATPCEKARMRCAYRTGCGTALTNYLIMCNTVLSEPTTVCPKACGHALIALTSTEEGKELMNCQCEDDYCQQTKRRMEVCRPQVIKEAANATSSCRLSQLICLADAQCGAALGFYNDLCRSMYRRGRKCSNKCMNSIDILRKQEKAAGLIECRCDGNEDYDCPRMQRNLQRLCFHKKKPHGKGEKEERERDRDRERNGERHHKKVQSKIKYKEVQSGDGCVVSVTWLTVLISVFSLMFNT